MGPRLHLRSNRVGQCQVSRSSLLPLVGAPLRLITDAEHAGVYSFLSRRGSLACCSEKPGVYPCIMGTVKNKKTVHFCTVSVLSQQGIPGYFEFVVWKKTSKLEPLAPRIAIYASLGQAFDPFKIFIKNGLEIEIYFIHFEAPLSPVQLHRHQVRLATGTSL